MRILFIHEVNYLTKPIFEMHEFPEQLALRGHDIAFLHFPESSAAPQKRLPWKMRVQARVALRATLTLYSHFVFLPRIFGRLQTVFFSYFEILRAVRDFKPQVIVSYSVPTTGWQAVMVAKRSRIPIVFRAIDVSHLIRRTKFSRLVQAAERFIYRESTLVSANNPELLEYCRRLAGPGFDGTVHLPPIDLDRFAPRDDPDESGRKRLIYMGSFFYFSGLETVIRNFCALPDLGAELVIVGGGETENDLRKLASNCNSSLGVSFPGFASFGNLPRVLQSATIAINPMVVDVVSTLAFPNKLLQYLACGLTVVSTDLRGAKSLLGHHSKIVWCDGPEQVIQAVQELLSSPNSNSTSDDDEKILSRFDYPESVSAFEDTLVGLVSLQNEKKIRLD